MKKTVTLFLGIALLFASCETDNEDNDSSKTVNQEAFLTNTADNIILPAYSELNTSIAALRTSIDSFAARGTEPKLKEVQSKLKTAYLNWQKVSHLEFGPAETVGLKSNVNIFPVNEVQIENNISSGNANLDALSNKVAKGFPALDFLLHEADDSTLLTKFQQQNRVDYLQLVVTDLKSKVETVTNEWNSYRATFVAVKGTDVGSSTGILVNTLNLHFEKFFRDNKIGIPLGVRSSGIPRPEFSEALHGSYSVELALQNLQSMKELYTGKTGYGLDDYLDASDANTINTSILAQFDLIEMRLKALSDPLPLQIAVNPEAVQLAYNEMQKLIVFIKVDLPSRMGILITYQDNDGD